MPTPTRSRLRARVDDALDAVAVRARSRLDSAIVGPRLRAAAGVASRLDAVASMVNSLTGLGGETDKGRQSRPATSRALLSYAELEHLYRFDGYARRYVDRLVSGMTAEGWQVKDGSERVKLVEEEERRLGLVDQVAEGLRLGMLYGGAIVVVLTDDDSPSYADPLDLANVGRVRALLPFDAQEFTPAAWETDPESPWFGEVRAFHLAPTTPGYVQELSGLVVHRSRVLYFPGRRLPRRLRQQRNGLDDSILEAVIDKLADLNAVDSAGAIMAHELKRDVLRIEGLGELEAGPLWAAVEARIRAIAASSSAANLILLGDGETFESREVSATGYRELRDGSKSAWSAVTGMPQTVAFGDSPSGLRGGKDDAGEQQWQAVIADFQASHLARQLDKLYGIILSQSEGPTGGTPPASWRIEFVPIWSLTPTEEVARRMSTAQADALYVNAGILDPEEIRRSRFGEEGWSFDLLPVDPDHVPEPPAAPAPVVPAAPADDEDPDLEDDELEDDDDPDLEG